MKDKLKRWWPLIKVVLALTILILVGIRFTRDLQRLDLRDLRLRPVWLVISALLYLMGLVFSGLYWYFLLRVFGERPRLLQSVRAYYVSLLGKYVPGKALSLIIRGSLARSPDVKFGVTIIAAFYEVLTTMAAGALVAALLFAIWPPQIAGLNWNPAFLGLLLVSAAGIPLLPGVFNRLVRGLAKRFQKVQSFRLPELKIKTLLMGVAMTSVGWTLLGLSLWALVQAIVPDSQAFSPARWCKYTAMLGLSYVAGFMAVVVPGGVGVREVMLLQFLPKEIDITPSASAEPIAALAIILLRLLWTAAELLAATVFYFWPGAARVLVAEEVVDAEENDAGQEKNPGSNKMDVST